MSIRTKRLECQCTNPSHNVRAVLDTVDASIHLDCQLNSNVGFFTRLWTGLLYIMGRSPAYASVTLTDRGVDDLSVLIVQYRMIKSARLLRRKKASDPTKLSDPA